ncbi:Uncharacterised protein [Mycobacteroides abscessus subsp. abscessus]|nr:Uncharacterised protein [Mycobacteroides abscessus subsp. abscessus]
MKKFLKEPENILLIVVLGASVALWVFCLVVMAKLAFGGPL